MTIIFIKPIEGLQVYNPFTKRKIAQEGEKVAMDSHWVRLERQGAITIKDVEAKKGSKE